MHSDYYSTVGNTPCVVKNRHLKSEYCYLAPLSKKAVSADKAFLQAIINDHNFKSWIQLGGTEQGRSPSTQDTGEGSRVWGQRLQKNKSTNN